MVGLFKYPKRRLKEITQRRRICTKPYKIWKVVWNLSYHDDPDFMFISGQCLFYC